MSDDFDINDGSRRSLLDRGRALTGETEDPVDPALRFDSTAWRPSTGRS